MWKHPNYYKKLRKRNRDLSELQQVKLERSVPQSDQAISSQKTVDVGDSVRPGPGPKPQATSSKQQAVDLKINLERVRKQYTSSKHQASSAKLREE